MDNLNEVGNNETSTSRAECYLESKVSECFTIHIDSEDSAFNECKLFLCSVCVDGIEVVSQGVDNDLNRSVTIIGPRRKSGGSWKVQPLIFADIQIGEEGADSSKPEEVKKFLENLGLISVKIYRARAKRPSTKGYRNFECKGFNQLEEVSEKALKGQALDTKTILGVGQDAGPRRPWTWDMIDKRNNSYLTFTFKYRSHKALQTMWIIPGTPSPVLEPPRPVESLSREELMASLSTEDLRELVKRRANPMPAKTKTKSEVKHEMIKRERDEELDEILCSAQPSSKKARASQAEVIDLLD